MSLISSFMKLFPSRNQGLISHYTGVLLYSCHVNYTWTTLPITSKSQLVIRRIAMRLMYDHAKALALSDGFLALRITAVDG